MSRILSLPTTYIVCRGETSYGPIGSQGSLHHVEVRPKVQSESINVDLSDLSFESVAIEDGTDLGENTLQWITTSMSNQTWSDVQNRTLTCDDSIKDTYMDELRFLVSKGYNISSVTASLSIGDVPDIMYDYTTKTLSATVDTGQSYDLSWSISVEQEAMYNPYNIPISSIIEIVKTDATHAELRFKNTDYFPWLFGIMTVTLTDSVSGLSTEAEIECMVQWDVEISGPQTIDSSSNDFVYDILMRNLNTGAYAQLARKKDSMQWSIFDTATDPYLIGKATIRNTSRMWGHLNMDWSNITADGEYQLSVRVECTSSAYMFYPYWKDYATLVEVDTSSHALQSLEIRDLASTIYTGTNSYPFKIYFNPSDADVSSLVGNVVGVTPSDYSDFVYNIGMTKHTDSYGSYVDASISYADLTKEGQLQVYVFDPNTGNRDDVYIVSEAPNASPLTSLSIEGLYITHIKTSPGIQRHNFKIYIDPANSDLSNLVWDNYYAVTFVRSRCSFDSSTVHYDGTRYYIDAFIEFEDLSSTGIVSIKIEDSLNPSVYGQVSFSVLE